MNDFADKLDAAVEWFDTHKPVVGVVAAMVFVVLIVVW